MTKSPVNHILPLLLASLLSVIPLAAISAEETPDAAPSTLDSVWSSTKEVAGDAAKWTGDKAEKGWDNTKQGAGEVWSATKEKSAEAADWSKEKAGAGVETTKKGAGKAWDGTKEVSGKIWEGTKDATGKALKWTGDKAQQAGEALTGENSENSATKPASEKPAAPVTSL